MTVLRNVHSTLQEFARKNNLSLNTLASIGYITLLMEDNARIHITPIQRGRLVLSGRLCAMPKTEADQEATMDKLLNLAYLTARTAEVYPALEPDQYSITLQMLIAQEIKLWTFEKKIEHFMQQFTLWRNHLHKK